MYAQLGNIRFEGQKGFSSFSHERGVNYVQHERINGKPRLQSVGDNLDTISFDMYLHSDFSDPETDIDALNVSMESKEVLLLLLGNGKIVGDFVITNFSQENSFTDPVGNLISVTLSVSLLEVISDDRLRESERLAIANAFATQQRNSNVRNVLPPKLSKGMGMTVDISKIQTSSTLADMHVKAITETPAKSDVLSEKIGEVLDKMEGYISDAESVLTAFPELVDLVPDLPGALSNVYIRIQDLRGVLPILDVDNASKLSKELIKYAGLAKSANVNLGNSAIIRRI